MAFKSSFSGQLYTARTKLKLTQTQVADAASISLRWYQQLEKGSFLPSATVMMRLILFLHIDIEIFRDEVNLYEPVSVSPR